MYYYKRLNEAPTGKVMQIFAGHAAGVSCGCWGLGGKATDHEVGYDAPCKKDRRRSICPIFTIYIYVDYICIYVI